MVRRRRRTYSAGEAARRRHSWLELVHTSGPFLTLPVVDRVWPNGLPEVSREPRRAVRAAVAGALESRGATRYDAVRTVLCQGLDWGQHLRWGNALPAALGEPVAEHGLVLTPGIGFYAEPHIEPAEPEPTDEDLDEDNGAEPAASVAPTSPWRMLGLITDWGTHPLARTTTGGWAASPVERLAVLLRARNVPTGVVTDGRWWAVVWAPVGGTTGAAVWDASLWGEEPESFRAFVALLQRPRFLAVEVDNTLSALLAESLDAQEEVTETLGLQVRDAVELLLETLDRLDAESGFLGEVTDDDLYDGVVTLMMRVVFLLFAEERRLLPSDDDIYVAAYSIGRLVEQLEAAEALGGPQALEYRTGAWHRLLATSRALHSGVAHEDLRLPPYGGGLFDPDRFPWLEGRTAGEDASTRPPAVDDATVLRLLRAVQYVEVGGERRKLTFRALDVEQIGYVYEGLLELEVRTATEVTLSLTRPKDWPKSKEPSELPLSLADSWLAEVPPRLASRLKARTGRTESGTHPRAGALPATKPRPVLALRPPDLIIQDELHLIADALGSMVGLYETVIDALCTRVQDGAPVRPVLVASTATVRRAKDQVEQVFARDLAIFPPQVLDAGETFFSTVVPPSPTTPSRRYRGICATGERFKSIEIRVAAALLEHAQYLFDRHGAAADPYMTLVDYFTSTRELAGMRRLVEDDVAERLTSQSVATRRRRPQVSELTSRMPSSRIATTLADLERPFSPRLDTNAAMTVLRGEPGPDKDAMVEELKSRAPALDVLLATSMLQVGVDVQRLGLMLVNGQPKSTAEYIQATSRVGRDRSRPGLIVTLYQWSRPRDLAHYERFAYDHTTFGMRVEGLTTTPYSDRALDRGLSAVLAAGVRHSGTAALANTAASSVALTGAGAITLLDLFQTRASRVTHDAAHAGEVRQQIQHRLDDWHHRRTHLQTGSLGYQQVADVTGLLHKPDETSWDTWTAPMSLREVEPEVLLQLDRRDHSIDNAPAWTYDRTQETS